MIRVWDLRPILAEDPPSRTIQISKLEDDRSPDDLDVRLYDPHANLIEVRERVAARTETNRYHLPGSLGAGAGVHSTSTRDLVLTQGAAEGMDLNSDSTVLLWHRDRQDGKSEAPVWYRRNAKAVGICNSSEYQWITADGDGRLRLWKTPWKKLRESCDKISTSFRSDSVFLRQGNRLDVWPASEFPRSFPDATDPRVRQLAGVSSARESAFFVTWNDPVNQSQRVTLWNAGNDSKDPVKEERTWHFDGAPVSAAATCSPSGAWVCYSETDIDESVSGRLHFASSGKEVIHTVRSQGARQLRFLSDRYLLAWGDQSFVCPVILWDSKSPEKLRELLPSHVDSSVQISNRGTRFLLAQPAAEENGNVLIFDASGDELKELIRFSVSHLKGAWLDPAGSQVAIWKANRSMESGAQNFGSTLTVHRLADGETQSVSLSGPVAVMPQVCFDESGSRIATWDQQTSRVQLWDTDSLTAPTAELNHSSGVDDGINGGKSPRVKGVVFLRGNRRILTWSTDDGRMRVWSSDGIKLVEFIAGYVEQLVCLPDDTVLTRGGTGVSAFEFGRRRSARSTH